MKDSCKKNWCARIANSKKVCSHVSLGDAYVYLHKGYYDIPVELSQNEQRT